ncbi:MAG TPA: alginate lyase family protein [Candidatus Paceibacterota bacterium]
MKKFWAGVLIILAAVIFIGTISYTMRSERPVKLSTLPADAGFALTEVPTIIADNRILIMRDADLALQALPVSITAFVAPQSPGSPHDYFSNADYYWPDPKAPAVTASSSVPYVRIDGMIDPANFEMHRMALRQTRDNVAALAAGYVLTRNDAYAAKAVQLLTVFFITPETRMNPSLEYAQYVPGNVTGRSFGIIDGIHLVEIARSIERLHGAPSMSATTESRLKRWFSDYTDWLTLSIAGRQAAATSNNHAVAYYMQLAEYAHLLNNKILMDTVRDAFKRVLIPVQMATDGSFPAELSRTRPYNYSMFQLDNLATIAQLATTEKDNLWRFRMKDGRGIKKAAAFMYPYIADKTKWPYPPDTAVWDILPSRRPGLLFAGLGLNNEKYIILWDKLARSNNLEVRRNIAVTQPVLWLDLTPQIAPSATATSTAATSTIAH